MNLNNEVSLIFHNLTEEEDLQGALLSNYQEARIRNLLCELHRVLPNKRITDASQWQLQALEQAAIVGQISLLNTMLSSSQSARDEIMRRATDEPQTSN